MTRWNRNQQPKFFWQGAGILLPVVVLAVVGLVSLRQDERAAEQDARERAAQGALSLARAMRSPVEEDIRRFVTLQSAWTTRPPPAGQGNSSNGFSDASLKAELGKWERDYPELKISEWAVPEGEILSDGRTVRPPPIPAAPVPPQWFCGLAPEQRKLWDNLRGAIDAHAGAASIRAASQAFLAAQPSAEASEAAMYLTNAPEQILKGDRALATEAGISFQDVACWRLLGASNAPLSALLLEAVWRQLEHPSFVTPVLLKLAEDRTNEAGEAVCESVRQLQGLWRRQSLAREWLALLRPPPISADGYGAPNRTLWVSASGGSALAFCRTLRLGDGNASGEPRDGRQRVLFLPEAVVQAIFARALAQNEFLVPRYARAEITVMEKKLIGLADSPSTRSQLALGGATQEITESVAAGMAIFGVMFYLTGREEMLSTELRRARLFVGLILAAFLATLAGLLAARRAFYRQLRLNELKSNFVSSVSHELRAPIASMRLLAESLELGKIADPQKQKEYFRFIGQEGRRLSALIENVLDFSRIEQGRKQYEMEPSDLAALTRETINLMTPSAVEKGARIELRRTLDAEHSEVHMDGRAIQRALVNLIDNAIKHSPEGGVIAIDLMTGRGGVLPELPDKGEKPATPVRVADKPGAAENTPSPHPPPYGGGYGIFISVEDHGEGIPTEDHAKIFERFYRRGSELRRKTPGVGIGLSIVKHIVEAHGGRVHVRSAPGRGSRFVIELPLKIRE